jgi:hypothetical protein
LHWANWHDLRPFSPLSQWRIVWLIPSSRSKMNHITSTAYKKKSVFGLQGRGIDSQAVADPWRLQIHIWERSTSKAVVSSVSPGLHWKQQGKLQTQIMVTWMQMHQFIKSSQQSVDAREKVYTFRECRQAVVSRPIARPRYCGHITRH